MAAINKNALLSNGMCNYAEPIIGEIRAIYSAIKVLTDVEQYQDTSNHLKAVFQRLEYLIARDISDKHAEELLSNSGLNSAFDVITRFRSMYIAKLEIEHAKSILKSKDPGEALKKFAHLPNYLQLARTEYQGSGLRPGDCVLFLGSCWIPFIVMNYRRSLRNISGYDQNSLLTIPWLF